MKTIPEIKTLLEGIADSVRVRNNRLIVARRAYYHKPQDDSAEKFETRVSAALGSSTINVVSCRDCFNQWPKDSYFEIIFTQKEGGVK